VNTNLRHLRVFSAVCSSGYVTAAAEQCCISQPAVTQAVRKLEREYGTSLFERMNQRLYPTASGLALEARVKRAFDYLDASLGELSPRLKLTATGPKLRALVVMANVESFARAAAVMGIAQPTVHRAVTQLELEAGLTLFKRTSSGVIATRAAKLLARGASLAFSELEQAAAEIAEIQGREVGRIVIGAMPLSRAYLLPRAIARFRDRHAQLPIRVLEGPYSDLLSGLRRGDIDFLIGALRDPAPAEDVDQELLFSDTLTLLSGNNHPLLKTQAPITLAQLALYPWVVTLPDAPARQHFDQLFIAKGMTPPQNLVESGSLILLRELLQHSEHLGCISRLQAEAEIKHGLVRVIPFPLDETSREIGLTFRSGWAPTRAQSHFLERIRQIAKQMS